jgi:hypothetical protein
VLAFSLVALLLFRIDRQSFFCCCVQINSMASFFRPLANRECPSLYQEL